MKKRYIIEDARKHLVEQINGIEGIERTAMQGNLVKNTKGLSAVIPKDNDGYCTVYKMDCDDGLSGLSGHTAYLQ